MGVSHAATCRVALRKVEAASTFSATYNAIFRCETSCKHWVSHEEVFLATFFLWGMPRDNVFDLGTPGKPVLSYFPAKIPPIKQWTTSNFLINFVIHDRSFRIGVQSLYRKMGIKS